MPINQFGYGLHFLIVISEMGLLATLLEWGRTIRVKLSSQNGDTSSCVAMCREDCHEIYFRYELMAGTCML